MTWLWKRKRIKLEEGTILLGYWASSIRLIRVRFITRNRIVWDWHTKDGWSSQDSKDFSKCDVDTYADFKERIIGEQISKVWL